MIGVKGGVRGIYIDAGSQVRVNHIEFRFVTTFLSPKQSKIGIVRCGPGGPPRMWVGRPFATRYLVNVQPLTGSRSMLGVKRDRPGIP